jgi:hypothetical protein
MALYDTEFGLPQSMVDYLNQGLPSIQQPYRPGYDKNYGPGKGMGYTAVMPQPGYQYVYGPDGRRYSIPIPGYDPNENADIGDPAINPIEKLSVPSGDGGDGFSPYDIRPGDSSIRTPDQYSPYTYRQAAAKSGFGIPSGILADSSYLYPQKTGIEQLLSKIPTPFGFIRKGLDALADKLPVNRTGIFQNELLGGGFKLDNIGRIVTDNYNTPEGIMAGYNPVSGGLLNMLTGGEYGEPTTYGLDKAYDKRRETVANTLKEKYGMSDEDIEAALAGEYTGEAPINPITGKPTTLVDRLGLFNQSQNLLNKRLSMADLIFEQKREEKRKSDPAFIEQQKIEKNAETRRDFQQAVAARASAVAQEKANRDAARKGEGGGGDFAGKGSGASGPAGGQSSGGNYGGGDFAGKGSGASGPAGRFSDKRLKENIELIGKSPSNINIYKFNYKNNPTTYQGVMADEVSWASVKHPNGYMMVDYNKIDVEFKKI